MDTAGSIISYFYKTLCFVFNIPQVLNIYNENYPDQEWRTSWTIFYWAWWISWSPFVGIFIARISKGRTIREFILGVLLAPTLLTCLWVSIFGGAAVYSELFGYSGIADAVNNNVATALHFLLEQYPLSGLMSYLRTPRK